MIYYSVYEHFGSFAGEAWLKYTEWRGITHVHEIVTTDSILCPCVIDEHTDEDWQFNFHEYSKTHFFRNPDYLARRADFDPHAHNLLAITQKPTNRAASHTASECSLILNLQLEFDLHTNFVHKW